MKNLTLVSLFAFVLVGCATGASSNRGLYLDQDTTQSGGGVANYGGMGAAKAKDAPIAQAPAAAPAATKEIVAAKLESLSKNLYFGSGSAKLGAKQRQELRAVADMMKANPDWSLSLRGHADASGKMSANQKLSLLRALSVRDELAALGVSPGRLEAKGMGPIDSKTADQKALARNVEVRLAD